MKKPGRSRAEEYASVFATPAPKRVASPPAAPHDPVPALASAAGLPDAQLRFMRGEPLTRAMLPDVRVRCDWLMAFFGVGQPGDAFVDFAAYCRTEVEAPAHLSHCRHCPLRVPF